MYNSLINAGAMIALFLGLGVMVSLILGTPVPTTRRKR